MTTVWEEWQNRPENAGKDLSYAPIPIREAAWKASGSPDYNAIDAKAAAAPGVSPDWATQGEGILKMFRGTYGREQAPAIWTREHAAELAAEKARLAAGYQPRTEQSWANQYAPAAASDAARRPGAGPAPPRYPDDVASELVARLYAQQFPNVPLELARGVMYDARRTAPGAPMRDYWESAYGMAQAGLLDRYLGWLIDSVSGR